MHRKVRRKRILRTVLFIGTAVTALHVVVSGRIAAWVDQAAKAQEETVVANGIDQRFKEIEKLVIPNVVWDDAVRNLDNRFEPDWAHKNVGLFFYGSFQFSFAAVLDAGDKPIFGMFDGADMSGIGLQAWEDPIRYVVASVRSAEQARSQQQPRNFAVADNLRFPIQKTVPRLIDGRVIALTATLVQPDFGEANITGARAPIVVTGMEVNDQFVHEFGKRYLLQDIHLHFNDSRPESGEAHVGISDENGRVLATLDWTPEAPGSRLLTQVLPWTLMVVGSLLATALVLLRRGLIAKDDLNASEMRAVDIANHDALTGLWNRHAVEERLVGLAASAALWQQGPAILCLDLDHFTQLNDRLGHDIGDEVLRQTAFRLASICGDDHLCARFGGDAFAVLQLRGGPDRAMKLAQTIVAAFAEPFQITTAGLRITCSVGVGAAGPEILDAREMMRRADLALFRAKADGRCCYRVYDDAMDAELQERGQLTEALRHDLSAGKLKVVYQPQIDAGGELIGAEALVRWTHEVRGAISPSTFIPLAERAGMIDQLGEYVFRQVLKDREILPDIKVAVNISPAHFQMPGFVDRILCLVGEQRDQIAKIELEVTETVLMEEATQVEGTLEALRRAGFSIALDDFGTGFSSLSYLRRLPIDKVKIDRSFISDLSSDSRRAYAMIKAIVELAHALDLEVLAEGVETREQWKALASAGCSQIQGYLVGAAVTAPALRALAEQRLCFLIDRESSAA